MIGEAAHKSELAARESVTVVIVSDYEEAEQKSWFNERAVLRALSQQDFPEPFEVILMENEQFRASMPADLFEGCPDFRMEFCGATTSGQLKDEASRRANGQLIAILEADCTPAREWLRHMVSALRGRPDCAAVSGKTLYPGRSVFARCRSLLDRGALDPGGSGPTFAICNNNSIVRRAVLAQYPYPAVSSPFLSAALRWKAMNQDNLRFLFEAGAVVYHALPGWGFVKEMHLSSGYTLGFQVDGKVPMIFRGLARHLYYELRRSWRLRHHYAVASYEVPFAWALAIIAKFYEFKGARSARRGGNVPRTSYR